MLIKYELYLSDQMFTKQWLMTRGGKSSKKLYLNESRDNVLKCLPNIKWIYNDYNLVKLASMCFFYLDGGHAFWEGKGDA